MSAERGLAERRFRALEASYASMRSEGMRDTVSAFRWAVEEIDRLRAANAEAERLADAVETFAFTTEKDLEKLRTAWQAYVETADGGAT